MDQHEHKKGDIPAKPSAGAKSRSVTWKESPPQHELISH